MKKTIPATDLTYFSDCRRQWWLSQNYVPKKPNGAFWLGSAVHAGLEAYYKTQGNLEASLEAIHKFAHDSIEELSQAFPLTWDTERQAIDDLYELSLGMMTNYSIFDGETPLPGVVIPGGVERYIKVPLLESPYGTIYVSGKIDLLMERSDGLWVIDHKTMRERPSYQPGLDVDEQLTTYAYLVWKTWGVIPSGVLYNMLVKSLPSSPTVLKSGGLSKAVDQRTVYSLYLATLEEKGLPLEEYSTILNVLSSRGWSSFFGREGSSRTEAELRSFERRARRKAQDILGIREDPELNAYPNPTTGRCSWCSFLRVCQSMDDGSDYQALLDVQFYPSESVPRFKPNPSVGSQPVAGALLDSSK